MKSHETLKNVGGYWEATGRLLGGYWEVTVDGRASVTFRNRGLLVEKHASNQMKQSNTFEAMDKCRIYHAKGHMPGEFNERWR